MTQETDGSGLVRSPDGSVGQLKRVVVLWKEIVEEWHVGDQNREKDLNNDTKKTIFRALTTSNNSDDMILGILSNLEKAENRWQILQRTFKTGLDFSAMAFKSSMAALAAVEALGAL
mmetsp:Transcript_9179/g.26379  ORF Transcript_9179/g.26379 Transcript_9179/m.26379 type:complete len:117 (+) Transcript_9179:806-1156(+)